MQKITGDLPLTPLLLHLPQTKVSLCLQKGTTVLCPFGAEQDAQPGGRLGFQRGRRVEGNRTKCLLSR